MRSACLSMVLCLASCGGGPSQSECAARAHEELAIFLGSFDHAGAPVSTLGVTLAARADGAEVAPASAPSVVLGPSGTGFEGHADLDRAELQDRLAQRHGGLVEELELARGTGRRPTDPALLYLVIDQAAPWARVVALLEVAHAAGFVHPVFPFARGPRPTPPPRSAIDDRLDQVLGADAGERATAFARIASEVVRPCPALARSFGAIASEESDRAGALLASVEPALLDCRCRVDVPALRSLLFRLLATEPLGYVHLTLDPAGPALVLPAATAWRDAGPRLTGATTWLRVDGDAGP